jgi:ABC-type amino acid transport substrate-binding protein
MKWMGADESAKTVLDISMLPATKGTLNMVTEADYEPFNYFKEGKVVGLDIDIAADFCKAKGYALNLEVTEFSKIIPAIQEGKYDFAGAGITVTDERKEVVNFSSPNYSGGVVMVVRK